MTKKIVITDTACLDALPDLLRKLHSPTWSYLGTNSSLLYRLKPILNRIGKFVCLGQPFNETAATIRQDFLDFDSVIDLEPQDQLQWSSTHFAEKSPLSSTLFENTCTALTFSKFIKETQEDHIQQLFAHLAANPINLQFKLS